MPHTPPYCTYADIVTDVGLGELKTMAPTTDPVTGDPSPAYPNLAPNQTLIEKVIEEKSNYVDDMLNNRWIVPITGTVPEVIRDIVVSLVRAELYQDTPGIPQDSETNRLEAEENLRKIARGMPIRGLTRKIANVTTVMKSKSSIPEWFSYEVD